MNTLLDHAHILRRTCEVCGHTTIPVAFYRRDSSGHDTVSQEDAVKAWRDWVFGAWWPAPQRITAHAR